MERLASTTRCTQIAAWGEGPDGEPRVLAAQMQGACLAVPSSGSFEAARALPGALDLGEAGTPPELTPLFEQGFSAVAPIRPEQTEAPAAGVLLLGGSSEPAGRVRPRTLANLAAAAKRLHAPIQAAVAAERLARLDQEVQKLNRLAILGELVAETVHEIRNPLVSVKTFLQLLPEREEDPGFEDGFLEVAREEIQRIERLLNTLLQHGRPPREEGGGDLAEALGSVIQLARLRADDREISLVAELPDALPSVGLGGDALRQVLLNLTLNAIEASPTRGTVRIAGRLQQAKLRIDIEDEGAGIPAEMRPHLFTPFFSTKPDRPGGLGLAISARIVEEAGGLLRASDRPGGGTRLRLTLPLA